MKKNNLLLVFCFITYLANAQAPFITTWDTSSLGNSITIDVVEDDDIPDNYTIDFGDGTILTNQSGEITHTYSSNDIYTVTMSGEFSRISFGLSSNPPSDSNKLLTVEQWGDIQWTSMENAFLGCSNLTITATDAPDLSNVTTTKSMFSNCNSFNQDISNWDMSNVNNTSSMFFDCNNFNQSLNNWDVSSVTNMSRMFADCTHFNQPLDNWNVSNVVDMSEMFGFCPDFNQSLNSWNVSSVTNMNRMFVRALSFNQPLDNWNVSNVTNMRGMFNTTPFNQPIDNWDVSSVTNMGYMFWQAHSFNQPLNSWDVSNVTDMSSTFFGCISFNQPLNNWDVSNVTTMEAMFWSAFVYNQPLDNWNVSNVIKMGSMFNYAYIFNQDLSGWNFNTDITFENIDYPNPQLYYTFLGYSGLDVNNYDALLNRFKELGLENKTIGADELEYCDEETRNYLINELGWTIDGDSLAEDCTATTVSFTEEQLLLYPNPVNDILHIEVKSAVQLEEVKVYNLQGSQLMSLNQNFENISTESLSSGIYILSIQTNKGSAEYKLIKN
ncbi:hypothetical protein GCM10007424_02760 [Flavobacterium suaedae]|uniref:PKD domain-containing protein n=1 Tax=Flavobacterium suaedae TaxID=1767027 RepID=A0ABQ1JE59_9FLAO|nr:BspA family leucine-rich repeat surface protein [Flavobacterium suaedae]GGB66257.1 hypothetical protein GCM10007424_02760 [Flavobacterium suaedae]